MRTMRLSQTVSPFGVGAILDVLGESLIGADISQWPFEKTRQLKSARIELALGAELRSAPSVAARAAKRTPGVYYQRFPRWLFCQNCRRMRYFTAADETGGPPACAHCRGGMVPMRFIAVGVRHGHAMDVPWDRWAHSAADNADQERCKAPDLLFKSTQGGTEGLSSLYVKCVTCGASRNLGDLPLRDSLKRIGVRCRGTQPWQRGHRDCDERVEVLQRGATNVTLADTTTALDIPEPSVPRRDAAAEVRRHQNFERLQSAPGGPRAQMLIEIIAEDLGVTQELVRHVATSPVPDDDLAEARSGLMADEWEAFVQAVEAPGEPTGSPDFVVGVTDLVSEASPAEPFRRLEELVGDVVLVHRLREIRALNGFRRYDLEADLVDVDLGPRGRRWLPAVESFGEGVFLTLPEERLSAWESEEAVVERAELLERRRRGSAIGSRFGEVTPRRMLLHTFAHVLIRRLAFSCGYSAASLRERVYARAGEAPQAGVLLYTAAGDAEGTLGGLVRQGEAPRLARSILAALEEASWCSGDPVCRESRGQGLGSLNLAACHACCLTSETSCEQSNVLLDRVLLIGDDKTPGYFNPVLKALRTGSEVQ